MLRRSFLGALAGGAMLGAATPHRPIPLGFDTYSLRAWNWKAPQLIDFAAQHQLDTLQISSAGEYESFDPAYLADIKQRARTANLTIDAGIGCICRTSKSWSARNGDPVSYLQQGLRIARAVGARSMRVFMGSSEDRVSEIPIEQHMEETVKALRAVRTQALDSNVKIGVENHSGDMLASECRDLIEAAGKDFVGACLDTGNPMWVLEDPLESLEILGPYTVTTHIRDSVIFEHPSGAAWQWVALGDGIIDFDRFCSRFLEICPAGTSMQLENITGRPPRVIPYLQPDFWRAFGKMNSGHFARFLTLVQKGHPLMAPMVVEDAAGKHPPEYDAALRIQQQRDLEKGLEYAKKSLGVGINWQKSGA